MVLFHTAKPVFDENSLVILLGTFPSPKSREYGFFYGHLQNRFWRVLAAVFESPPLTTIEEKKAFLLRERIALWDVIASCEIVGASDASIKNAKPNNLSKIFSAANIGAVYTTGTTASKLYRRFFSDNNIILPSTSPANAMMSLQKLVESYMQIKQMRDELLQKNSYYNFFL